MEVDYVHYELPHHSWVHQYPSLWKHRLEGKEYERFWNTHPEERGTVTVYGRQHQTPRWFQSFGRDYTFSREEHESLPITDPYLVSLLKWVNSHAHYRRWIPEDLSYNGILVNWYQDGDHHIGAHSDSEKGLVPEMPIFSFSFGQERTFVVTSKGNELEEPLRIQMPDNSLLVMGGKMQKYYKHAVPKQKYAKGSRINITMRIFRE